MVPQQLCGLYRRVVRRQVRDNDACNGSGQVKSCASRCWECLMLMDDCGGKGFPASAKLVITGPKQLRARSTFEVCMGFVVIVVDQFDCYVQIELQPYSYLIISYRGNLVDLVVCAVGGTSIIGNRNGLLRHAIGSSILRTVCHAIVCAVERQAGDTFVALDSRRLLETLG